MIQLLITLTHLKICIVDFGVVQVKQVLHLRNLMSVRLFNFLKYKKILKGV